MCMSWLNSCVKLKTEKREHYWHSASKFNLVVAESNFISKKSFQDHIYSLA